MKNDGLGIPLLSSVAIHICVFLTGAVLLHSESLRRQNFVPIALVDLPRPPAPPPTLKIEAPPEREPPAPPPKKIERPKKRPTVGKTKVARPKQAASLPPTRVREAPVKVKETPVEKEELPAPVETKPLEPTQPEIRSSFASDSPVEGGGSEAGAGNLFDEGDVGVLPGFGVAGGGGGTAASGWGRGSGTPGLPAQSATLKTHREAKPIQTVRANYPPMALRMGMESDVTLKIEVDVEGKVTMAEIIKSGGAGFDEEALNAVKQFRFEPAEQDGHTVPAEFTYIYRFRLHR